MQAERYFGTYARFETASKREAAALLGADNLVGDSFDIVFETEDGSTVAWLRNRFGGMIGYLDQDLSRKLNVLSARGWSLNAVLSFVAFTDTPKPGFYWGQVAVMCFDKKHQQEFDQFVEGVSKRLAGGVRPDIALGEQGVGKVISSKGSWTPKDTVKLPGKEEGTAIVKDSRKLSEKLIEQSRQGNKGCYAASWGLLLVIIAGALFGLKSCGVF
ncbi:MAG: hypothetical protein ACLSVD_09785 [Eggerthellaceae bacterium]